MIQQPVQSSDQTKANFARWYTAMEASHQFLMAGLREQVGPDGDVHEAYRQWNAARRERKLRALQNAAKRFEERMKAATNRSSHAS